MYRSKWSSLVKQHVKQKGFNKVLFRRSLRISLTRHISKDQPNQIQPEQSDQSPVGSSNKDDDQCDIIQCLAHFSASFQITWQA